VKVLITGAGGMLGQDVRKLADLAGHEVVALDRAALDVTDAAAVDAALAEHRPDTAINCAAWTDVDGAESDEAGALALNGDAAGNVAAAAAAVGAVVVLPSTDYVFDGRGIPAARGSGPRPYVESDPTGPLSAYGRTKLAGERVTAAANARHFVVRTSWLFGVGGGNFVETMLGLADRGELRVVDDQVGSPTYTPHLADGLLRLAQTTDYGIHHMAGSGHCSWYELARATFAGAGVEIDVAPVTTAEFPRPAPRPAWSVLGSERPRPIELPDWRDGLRSYLSDSSGARRT
jgi:dTDP-4-dehydrorhamnose reductase